MLFSYTYVPHRMERMQRFINFIFYQVWCRALKAGPYNLSLFDPHPSLSKLMTTFAYDHTQAGDHFSNQIQIIYQSFAQLSRKEVAQFKRWYQANNDLEKICANDPAVQIVRYKDVVAKHPILGKQLASFFRGLYDNSFLELAAVKTEIGNIKDHNKEFFTKNSLGKCPFCGISDLKGIYHTRREAYDHYLPKYRYPFNSINFRNLAPACHECNSAYKLSKDPIHNVAGRRKAFYPYAATGQTIELEVNIKNSDIANIKPADITLKFGPMSHNEEIETWKDVYGIEERFKAKFCGDNDGKYWLTQVLDECEGYDMKPIDILNMRTKQTQRSPYADSNFLRKPFLDACKAIGIFDSVKDL